MINLTGNTTDAHMTFSILAKDPHSRAIGGAAATGSLCVGGWVLRGRAGIGMSASQGKAPSTIWGERCLDLMARGEGARQALRAVVDPDRGKDQRQLSVLDATGNAAAFSGADNTPDIAERLFAGGVATGNMLAGAHVVDAMAEAFASASGPFPARLLSALHAGERAGSDIRGLQSAALLVVSPDHAPLTLRIDLHDDPLAALDRLHDAATSGDYATWAAQVPTLDEPERSID